ncbi:retrovirus-related pol polyprotein from transposon TNT 1-94 [Tanacetum coccineum]|uniref:Retrovirus-related pol polyprotein from transposon TNT 1-94 n=1 Tax=Tanacetum coccineum TaxID=301880 RepID=A0ABQ5CNH6_9ASTR
MENLSTGANSLRSCLKATKIYNIDEKILGKDGKPMQAYRQVKFGVEASSCVESVNTSQKSVEDNTQPAKGWEDEEIHAMKNGEGSQKPSFTSVVNGTNEIRSNPKVNFKAMVNYEKVDNSNFVLPIAEVHAVKHKFDNSLVGFFVGKKVAFPLVKNYVTNTWTKFGFEKVMSDDYGVFYFKFASLKGLEQVLELGPWMIKNVPLILTKWSPNMSLDKDRVTKVPVWVKFHKVPAVAYSEVGLSLLGTQVGNPIMLDAFTSAMCVEA